MTNNLIPVIADCLGVRIGEKFKIVNRDKYTYYFTEDKLYEIDDTQPEIPFDIPAPLEISKLGNIEIIKFPFVPKRGDRYYSYAGNDFGTLDTMWTGTATNYLHRACGCVFRTEAEAIAARPEKYYELTGKKWEEANND